MEVFIGFTIFGWNTGNGSGGMSRGETALITGASMGLGAEWARLFGADGYDLVLVARSKDKLDALAEELESAHGIRTHVIAADLSEPKGPMTVWKTLNAAGIDVDVLINNAGFGSNGLFTELDVNRELDMIRVNIEALVHLTRLFMPGMVARKKGAVMNIASTAAFQPGPRMATYYATKAFVLSFSEALAEEVRKHGVSVTAHCPGATHTAFAGTAKIDRSRLFQMGAADAKDVAQHGYQAVQKGHVVSIPGVKNKAGAFMVRLSPRWLVRRMVHWINSPVG